MSYLRYPFASVHSAWTRRTLALTTAVIAASALLGFGAAPGLADTLPTYQTNPDVAPVAGHAQNVAVSSGGVAYVADVGDGVFATISGNSDQPTQLATSGSPTIGDAQGVALSPDGDTLYVATGAGVDLVDVSGVTSTNLSGLTSADPNSGSVVGSITFPDGADYPSDSFTNTEAVAVSPDGDLLYIADYSSDVIYVADVSGDADNDQVIGEIQDPSGDLNGPNGGPQSIALSPDGDTLYIASYDDPEIAVVNVSGISLGNPSSDDAGLWSQIDDQDYVGSCGGGDGACAGGVVVSPDGGTLYVADSDQDVSVFDIGGGAANAVDEGTIELGADGGSTPQMTGLALSPDGQALYAVDWENNWLDTVAVPQISAAPAVTVSGTAQVGSTLTANATLAAGTYVASYQWYANGAAISGATGQTLALTGAQQGDTITVTVQGAEVGYAYRSATSAATATVLGVLSLATPAISGTAKVGDALSVAGVSAADGGTLSYQWLADGSPISGATGSKLELTAAEAGKTVSVTVTETAAGYATAARTSAATAAVARGSLRAHKPTISGKAKQGKKLEVKSGKWGPSGVKLSYQWYANGKAIKGATKSSLRLTKKLKGKKIKVKVTGKLSGYTAVSETSAATRAVAA